MRKRDRQRGRRWSRGARERLESLALRCGGRGGQCPGSLRVPLPNEGRKFFHPREKGRELCERESVSSIGEGFRRIVMRFEEQTVHSRGDCRARERFNEFRLPAACMALP